MPSGLTRPERAFAVLVVVAGAALRVWVLRSELGVLDSDEAVAGLMALALLRDGDVTVFYWGQAYGGSLEPYLAVPALAVAGATPLALKLTTVALSAACATVAWRLARRWAAPFPAACVGLALWVAPGP